MEMVPLSRAFAPPAREELNVRQGQDLVRYWLECVKLEEALATRPIAYRERPGPPAPINMAQPVASQNYFKVSLARHGKLLAGTGGEATLEMQAEHCRYFESWLYRQYRQEGGRDQAAMHFGLFPAMLTARGELASLLRLALTVEFSGAGVVVQAPTYGQRRRGIFPPPPDSLHLKATASDDELPYFVDTRVLQQDLGFEGEAIDQLFAALRSSGSPPSAHDMLHTLIDFLNRGGVDNREEDEQASPAAAAPRRNHAGQDPEPNDSDGPEPEEALGQALVAAVHSRLRHHGSRSRVYSQAVVISGQQMKTTWHLQKELALLLRDDDTRQWRSQSAMSNYIRATPPQIRHTMPRACWRSHPPTTDQERAASRSLGSSLTAVQGPPGTGKTSTIHDLCAHRIVAKLDRLGSVERMGRDITVVVSTNNRAVDNALAPFMELARQEGRLPLALRAGNRRVNESVLLEQLKRAKNWLSRGQIPSRAQLDRATAEHHQRRETLDRRRKAQQDGYRRVEQELALSQRLYQLDKAADEGAAAATSPFSASPELLQLSEAIEALGDKCRGEVRQGTLTRVKRHWRLIEGGPLSQARRWLTSVDADLDLPLPVRHHESSPSVEEQLSCWEDAVEETLLRLEKLAASLRRKLLADEDGQERAELQRGLAALRREDSATAVQRQTAEELHDLQRAVLAGALELRELWALYQQQRYLDALEQAIFALSDERSLRSVFAEDTGTADALRELFPLWGCTLLSLGNVFPPTAGQIDHLIIDEAGQCHPAYAVSGLMRANAVLIIGDVQQLEPVIALAVDEEKRLARTHLKTVADAERYRLHEKTGSSVQAIAEGVFGRHLVLRDHFRCQPQIIAISDALCGYRLRVRTPRASQAQRADFLRHALLFLDCPGAQERNASSWFHPGELDACLQLITRLLERGIGGHEIAVITPYRGQEEALRRELGARRIAIENLLELDADEPMRSPEHQSGQPQGIALGTIHRFQGGERSIAIFSTVARRWQSLAFLEKKPNLLNVAVSRARDHLIVLGDADFLSRGRLTNHLVAEQRLTL